MRAMRFMISGLLAAGLVVLVASAQPGGFGGGGGDLTMQVLTNKDLQEELKITDSQKDKLKEIAEKRTEKTKGLTDKFKEAKGDKDKIKELFDGMQKDNEEFKKAVEDVLTADQKKRLKQLTIQNMGLGVFNDPEAKGKGGFGGPSQAQKDLMKEVQDALKLTDQQKSSVKGIVTDLGKERTEIFKDAFKGGKFDKDSFEAANKKIDKAQNDAFDKVIDLLTEEQKKKWIELVGDRFDTSKLRPQGGFGFPGGKN